MSRSSSGTTTSDTTLWDFLLISTIGSVVYRLLSAVNWDGNGIVTAQAVEGRTVAWANHMFFELTGVIAMKFATPFVGPSAPAYPVLETLTAIYGGLTLGVAFLVARQLGADRLSSLLAIAWLGLSWAFSKWSTNVAYMGLSSLLVGLGILLVWRSPSLRFLIAAGIVAALATLTWQANVFLLPVLMLGTCLQSKQQRIRNCALMVVAFTTFLVVAYSWMIFQRELRDIESIVVFFTTHGAGTTSPVWGYWGWERIPILIDTWIQSIIGRVPLTAEWFFSRPVRFNTVFPRLAPFAAAAFLIIPALQWFQRRTDRAVLFCVCAIAIYFPFLVWWDPWETKWLLVANLFLTLLSARLWSLSRRSVLRYAYVIAPLSVGIIAVSNLSLYLIPERTRVLEEYKAGDCVASHLSSSDLYVSPDWAFDGYISYRYRTPIIDLISKASEAGMDRPRALQAVAEAVRRTQLHGGTVYTPDPLSSNPVRFDLLQNLSGITRADLDELLPGQVGFECPGWPIREVRKR